MTVQSTPDLYSLKKLFGNYISFSSEEWLYFRSLIKVKSLKKNEHLLKQGTVCVNLYYVLSGSVRIYYKTEAGKEVSTRFSFEGEFATGLSSFITQTPSAESIILQENGTFMVLDYRSYQQLLNKYPSWEKLARQLTEKYYLHKTYREQLLLQKPKDRYMRFLETEKYVVQKIKQKYIASYLGMTPETLSRIKKRVLISG